MSGNRHSERSEVSRSHSSQMPIVMDGTGRRAEPYGTRTRLNYLEIHDEPEGGSVNLRRWERNKPWGYFNQYLSLENRNLFRAEGGSGNSLKTRGKRPVRARMRGVVGLEEKNLRLPDLGNSTLVQNFIKTLNYKE